MASLRGWHAGLHGVGSVLKLVALVTLEQLPWWCARQCCGKRMISHAFSINWQEMNIIQSYKKNSSLRPYKLQSCLIF